ncbi:MAG TPA: IS481 family transposase [Gemmatimonadaceae bacterium]
MNIHKNARLTLARREELARRGTRRRSNQSALAREFGVSRHTVRKWCDRFRREGLGGLYDRSSRPHHCPRQLSGRLRRRIDRLRRRRWSSIRIARHLHLPIPTVVVTQRRLGLARLRSLEPHRVIVRYERARPGELVHLDVKKLGQIGGRVGHRIHGNKQIRVRGAGWEYVHVAIDDATRLAYAAIFPDETKESATGFLAAAHQWFHQHGVTVAGLMTDNGNGFRSHLFRRMRLALGTGEHLFTRPYTPRTNGKAERFIQTLLREWAYAKAYRHTRTRARDLAPYLAYYNNERPHTALHDRTPAQRLAAAQL